MDLSEGDGELSVKAALLNEKADAEERYNCLFQYFLRGFIAYASPGFDRVFYPGMGSVHGYRVNAGAKMRRLAGAKIHRRCWQEGPELGAFSSGIRLGSDYPPRRQHWRGVNGAYFD
jgi:hypothetical protein